jgi:hypothetical protein
MPHAAGFVTDGKSWLVQLPANNDHGFVLCDEEGSWPGGEGAPIGTWALAPGDEVPEDVRERLGYLLDMEAGGKYG